MKMKSGMVLAILSLVSAEAFSASFDLPPANQSLIGQIQYRNTGSADTITTLQQAYNLGYNAIEKANPQINAAKSLPHSISTQHLLPNEVREGIIVSCQKCVCITFRHKSGAFY